MQKLFENWRKFRKNVLIELHQPGPGDVEIPGTSAILHIDEKIPKKIHKQITKTVFQATKDLIDSYKTGGSNSKIIMDLLIEMSAGAGKSIAMDSGSGRTRDLNHIKILINAENARQVYSKYVEPVFQEMFVKGGEFFDVNIVPGASGTPGGAENMEGSITINYPFYSFDGLYANLMHELEHTVEMVVEQATPGWDFPDELQNLLAKIIKVKKKELTFSQDFRRDARDPEWHKQGPQSIDGVHTPYFRAKNEIRARVKTAQHLLRKSSGSSKRIFMPEDIEIICKMIPQQERGDMGMTGGGNEPIVNKIGDITPEIAYVIRPFVDCEKAQLWAEYLNSVARTETRKSSLPAE